VRLSVSQGIARMKTLKYLFGAILILVGVFLVIGSARASGFDPGTDVCYEATGFGNASANGTYEADGVNGPQGFTQYQNENAWWIWNNASLPEWSLSHNPSTGDYYRDSPGPPGAYTANGGTAPGGTVATSTCPGGSATTTETSSLVDNPAQNLFNMFMIMYMTMFGVIWFFRRKT